MVKNSEQIKRKWALILGGSAGLGLATAKKLASKGYSIIVVHRDRKLALPAIEEQFEFIRGVGVKCISFNVDATNAVKQGEVIQSIKELFKEEDAIKVVVHSIAKGNVKTIHELEEQDFQLTIDAMGTSLFTWVKKLLKAEILCADCRVIAFTSEGNTKAIPNYAAVSAAKVVLESITRNMAIALAPYSINVNCIQAGVTDTASLNRIPNSELLKEEAIRRNPYGRLTTVEDVANAAYLLTMEEASWITGTTIKVDGGESLQ